MKGVSVIICCFNSASRLEPALQHLQNQRVDASVNWEIILVDNASTDGTSEKAKEIWNKNPVTVCSIVKEEKAGLMYARHKGLETAAYDIVSFIDDDNWVEEFWVQKVNDIFKSDERIGACGGSSIAVFEKRQPDWFQYFENNFAVGKQAPESGYIDETKGFLWDAGLSFRKSLWIELQRKGFKNLTVGRQGKIISAGEDTELCYAFRLLGYKLYYQSDLQLFHYMPENRMNIPYLEKMNVGFGRSFVFLNSYRVLLYPGTFKLRSWFYEWLVTKKNIILLLFKQFFAASKQEKWQLKTKTAYWKGYAAQLWQTKKGIQENISSLKSVFNTGKS